MAAYPLAKFQLRVKWIFNFVVVALLFNTTILWLPQYVILAKTGMLDTYLVYILPQLATPLGLFLMKQFMEQVPTPLIESATIDGAGLLDEDELPGAKKVLRAAALTYVAALLMSLLQLMRFVLIFIGRGGRDQGGSQ